MATSAASQQRTLTSSDTWSRPILGLAFANVECKIEKVPSGIRGEKSSKDMANSRNLVSKIGTLAIPIFTWQFSGTGASLGTSIFLCCVFIYGNCCINIFLQN